MNKRKTESKYFVVVLIVFSTLLALSFLVYGAYSYFTATATKQGEIQFATLKVNLVDKTNSTTETNSSFKTKYLNTKLVPGETISIDKTLAKNEGNVPVYALVNLKATIKNSASQSNYTKTWNKWYNLDGIEVDVLHFELNTTKPTKLSAGQTKELNFSWTFGGDVVSDAYQNGSASLSLTVYGVQTSLRDSAQYVDKECYASWFIVNSNKTATNTTMYGEPLMKINSTTAKTNYFDKTEYSHLSDYSPCRQTTSSVKYNYAKIPLEAGVSYNILIFRYNGFAGNLNQYLLFSDIEENNHNWTAVVHQTSPNTSKVSYTYTANSEGVIYIGYLTGNGMTQEIMDNIWANTDVMIVRTDSGIAGGHFNSTESSNSNFVPFEGKVVANDSVSQDATNTNMYTVTKNVGKYVFTGDESVSANGGFDSGINRYVITLSGIECVNYKGASTHFVLVPQDNLASVHYYCSSNIENATKFIFFTMNSTASEFKSWLKSEYDRGNPVTVWFQYKTAQTENIYTGNLYYGNQDLHYESGASDNTANNGASMYEIFSTDEIWKYIKDKTLTVSCKFRAFEDETTVNRRMTALYLNSSNKAVRTVQSRYITQNNGKWNYVFVTIENSTKYTDVAELKIWFADYSTANHRHFEIDELKIEVGDMPTPFVG